MKNCGKQEGADLYLWSGNPLYLVDRGGRWPLGWQEMMLKLQGRACTLPVVVLSSSSCHLAPLSWVWIPCIIGLQMDVGNNQYWFNSNVLKYCFEKGTGDPSGWARWDKLCFFSAINPKESVRSTQGSIDTELLHKYTVEGAQMDAAGKSCLLFSSATGERWYMHFLVGMHRGAHP